jgi:hypothetical protein
MDVTKCHTKSGVGIGRKLLELWSNKQLTEVTRAEIVSMYKQMEIDWTELKALAITRKTNYNSNSY